MREAAFGAGVCQCRGSLTPESFLGVASQIEAGTLHSNAEEPGAVSMGGSILTVATELLP